MPKQLQGQLALIPWSKPLVWIRGADAGKGKVWRARSVLAAPGIEALEIDRTVFSAAAKTL